MEYKMFLEVKPTDSGYRATITNEYAELDAKGHPHPKYVVYDTCDVETLDQVKARVDFSGLTGLRRGGSLLYPVKGTSLEEKFDYWAANRSVYVM
jgi:hypothetical protein